MRVSEQAIFNLANQRIMRARADSLQAGDQVSSGKRVEHPWDDAGDAGLIVRHEQEAGRQSGVMLAATHASDELNMVDGALDQVTTSLTRIKELAVQLSNDTYSANDRKGGAQEVSQLFGAVVSQLNVRLGERYLFGGMQDTQPPFDASGNYLGDANVRQVEIAPGVLQDASARADVALKGAGGGVDVLTAVQNFATALNANDTINIRAAVQNLDDAIAQVSRERSRVGGMQNVFDVASTMAKQNRDLTNDARSKLEDVDIFEASTRLQSTQRALEASMSAASQQFKLTLLDKL
ncbi:MAG: flagellar hook-associated protein FlgL [Myxococcaceae bacterium]